MGEMFASAAPAGDVLDVTTASQAAQTYTLLGVSPFTIDKDGQLSWASYPLASRLWRAADALLPRSEDALERRIEPVFCRARRAARQGLTWDGARYCVEYQIDLYDGQKLWVEERGQRLAGKGRRASLITATLADIDDRKRREQQRVYSASHDVLTGLWNEARFKEGLVFSHAAAKAFDSPSAFLRLKASNLADINSSYGYEVGDQLLKAVADRLSAILPAPHMLARIGGASFAVNALGWDEQGIQTRVDTLLAHISDAPYASQHGDLLVQFTVGSVSIQPGEASDIEALFSKSDLAIKKAAASGQTHLAYSLRLHGQPAVAERKETTSEDIIAALNDRRVSLAYQPIVDARTKELHHYECLLRLKREDDSLVSAGEFIMAAERLGNVHLLDRRALEIASQTLARYPDIALALNVSAATVKDMETANAYLEALRALGPMAARVTLELTETVALEDPAMASRFSVEARALGCEFSIDDFGSGHTSFQNLMAIEADSIKIDGSFIKDLSITPHKQAFIRMMVDLAQTFSVQTVAEMVETEDDAKLLKRLGVDYLQGYLFGVPSAAPAWQAS